MNELGVFILGALCGGIIAAVIAVFYVMYQKEKLNTKINAVCFNAITKLNDQERKSLERLNKIDQEAKDRYINLINDIEQSASKFRQGGIKT